MNVVDMIIPNLLVIMTIIAGIVSVVSKKREKKHTIYIRTGNGYERKVTLEDGNNIFGRDSLNADIILKDRLVSRKQFVITVSGKQMLIQDCNSTNGTYLNGERLSSDPRILKKGDIIKVGTTYVTVGEHKG